MPYLHSATKVTTTVAFAARPAVMAQIHSSRPKGTASCSVRSHTTNIRWATASSVSSTGSRIGVGLPRDTRKPPATSLASSRSSQFPSGSNSLTAPNIIAAQGTCSTPVLPSGDRQGQQDSIGPPANASCHDFSVVLVLKAIPRHPAGTAQLWQTPEARSQQLPLREV
jgi:hypothetical protein